MVILAVGIFVMFWGGEGDFGGVRGDGGKGGFLCMYVGMYRVCLSGEIDFDFSPLVSFGFSELGGGNLRCNVDRYRLGF